VSAAGTVGADPFGSYILDLLKQEHIDTTHVVTVPGATSTLVIVLTDQASGEHVFIGHYGEGPEVPYPMGLEQRIAEADLLFVMGYTLAEQRVAPMAHRAIEQALAARVPVYMDVGPFLGMVPPDEIRWVLARTSLLLTTEDEVPSVSEGRTGDEASHYLLAHGPATIVVKQGKAGCRVITKRESRHVPGYPVRVVDTVGAGDCFAGAFVAGQLHGLNLIDSARLANAMGAAAVQKVGAGKNAPTYDEVMAILHRAGERLNF